MLWSDSILEGKRILITGASSGIGRSCAIVCSQLGAEIIACGRNKERLVETLDSLSGTGHLALDFELNNDTSIDKGLSVIRGSKPISGFIHSAGIERTNPLKTICMDDFTEMFRVNVASIAAITRHILKPGCYDKLGMSLVFISSVSGSKGEKGKIEYSSTKAALIGLTKSLALEFSSKMVRVNSICPAMVKSEMLTRMFESLPEESVNFIINKHLGGIPEQDDVANMAVYLISDLSKHVTGSNFTIDSGYSLS